MSRVIRVAHITANWPNGVERDWPMSGYAALNDLIAVIEADYGDDWSSMVVTLVAERISHE